jgi:hypothetical protein
LQVPQVRGRDPLPQARRTSGVDLDQVELVVGLANRIRLLRREIEEGAQDHLVGAAMTDDQNRAGGVLLADGLQRVADAREELRCGLAAIQRVLRIVAPPHILCDFSAVGARHPQPLEPPQSALAEPFEAGERRGSVHDLRRFVAAARGAGVDGVEMDARERAGELCRLLPAGIVQVPVGPALQAALDVPVGLAVPGDVDPERARGRRRRLASAAEESQPQAEDQSATRWGP